MVLAEQLAPAPRSHLRRLGVPLLVLVAGLLCTGLAVFQLRSSVENAERQRFEALVSDQTDAILDRIDTYVALLRGAAGLFSASGDVTGLEFKSYFDRIQAGNLYAGLQGVGYAHLVRPEQAEAVVAAMRGQGVSGFRIWPEGERPVTTSILYLEPQDVRNQAAIGFDMFSEPVRRAAMERARDTGMRAATGRVVLVQEQGKNSAPGFLIYVPVYNTPAGSVPETVEERRATFRGWVYSPFRADILFSRAIDARGASPEIVYSVYDGRQVAENVLLYHSSGAASQEPYEIARTIEVAGHEWTVAARRTDAFVADSNRAVIPFVLAGGVLTTFLLFAASYAQTRATAAAEEAKEQLREANASLEDRVEERTAQLESARGSLETLNRNLETIIETRTADLQAANEEIQRFAYIVSHDLRSPLVNVMGFTSELQVARDTITKFYDRVAAELPEAADTDTRATIETDLPEAIDFIRSSTVKMDRLINAILRLSREGGRVLTPEPLDLKKLLEITAQTLTHQASDADAEITIEDVPEIVSDRLGVEQVFANLLENAVKYLAPGRPGRIRVRGWQEGSAVFIDVEDNGRGIDPKDHGRVFDLFRRAGAQDRPGEGIGLAHVRALVRRLGGTITLNSTLGEGSTFRVVLPKVLTKANEGEA